MKYAKVLSMLAGATLASTAFAADITRDDVRAMIAEMQANAESQTSLLQGGGNAGYDKKFFVASADNKFRLNFSGYWQFRYTASIRDKDGVLGTGVGSGGTAANGTQFNSGFQTRNVAVQFDGNVINQDLKYVVRIRSDNGTDPLRFDDAYVTYNLNDGWYIKGGQYKIAFSREQLISDTQMIGAERSINDAFFNGGRTQGLELGYKNDEWWFALGFNDGFSTRNSAWNSNQQALTIPSAAQNTAAYSIGGRADYTFLGSRDQLKDQTSKPGDKGAAAIGAAVNWSQARRGVNTNTAGTTGVNYPDSLNYTVDAQWEEGGWSAFGAFHGNYNRVTAPGAGGATAFFKENSNNLGVVVQGAYRWSNESEVFARYDGLYLSRRLASSLAGGGTQELRAKNYNFVTFGYTHYFADHAAKLVVDCVLSLNRTANPTDDATNASLQTVFLNGATSQKLGLLGTSKGIEAAIRAQFQLTF